MWGKNVIQLLDILALLSRPGGATRKELVEKLNVSDRTVSRILKTLSEKGFPVYDEPADAERGKRYLLEHTYVLKLPNITLSDTSLTYPEIIALFMLKGECTIFNGTAVETHIDSAFTKLLRFVPEKTRNDLTRLRRIFISKTVHSKPYTDKGPVIKTLAESILNQTACRITYHAYYKDKTGTEDIGPLHFYEHNGGLYLFALKLKTGTVHSYAVERIRRITSLTKNVDYPESFNPEVTLNSAFDLTHGDPLTVTLRFTPAVARYIKEKSWALGQTLTDHPDGSVTLTMTTSGRRDVKRWVMGFGKEVRVLEPEDLREEILEELKEILCGG
jgi:predicted DNA-binding transcriptional regulator YafY